MPYGISNTAAPERGVGRRNQKLLCRPSMTNCTASAPRITPDKRVMTLAPVTPITRCRGSATHINASATASTSAAATASPMNIMGWVCTRTGRNERKRQRKHGHVRPPLVLGALGARGARARFPGVDHLERDQEKEQSAENPERCEVDAHEAEEISAAEGEQQDDEPGDGHRPQSHLMFEGRACAVRQAVKERDEGHRLHDDEENDEELDQLLDHGAARNKITS
jgi:hypothetical protein